MKKPTGIGEPHEIIRDAIPIVSHVIEHLIECCLILVSIYYNVFFFRVTDLWAKTQA